MSSYRRKSVAALALGVAMAGMAAPAFAQQHPRLTPSRDVTVVYSVQPEKLPQPVQATVHFRAEGDKLRIDPANHAGSTILDRPAQMVTLIMNKQKVYTSFSPKHGLRSPFLLDMSMQFAPDGKGMVAGASCNKWSITSAHGKAEACVTDDGVILSEEGVDSDGLRGKLVAERITYAPLDESLFQPPAGYQKISAQMPIPHGAGPHGAGVQGAGMQGAAMQGSTTKSASTP
ncbi:DUF4412 domain-containing protein [Swaminathania salitolerans]|uniref:DUF4412 domain-containing protein n=1 Tax=Swaminathania salitolerans TaxID=182838 RepID=A0A511BNV6_9PROT|nr:DUF4412 domain-containing protein [Swaminathania salitolerans]GBQ10561.1 hypothetical protein AA21291_0475 [Swaminathania salitolerans LMG 21291]GEL01334.1 hypothetical protein SSA02_04970 [Swaminathania salitolerans]